MTARLLPTLLLVPALLVLAVLTFAGRRRTAPALPGLFAPPLPLHLPAAGPRPAAPDRFEAVHAGDTTLLRVHLSETVDRTDTMLILDHGDDLDVLKPLDGPADRGAIGFAVPGTHISEGARYWLEVGGRIVALGAPDVVAA